jgi:hypothetical protein
MRDELAVIEAALLAIKSAIAPLAEYGLDDRYQKCRIAAMHSYVNKGLSAVAIAQAKAEQART